MQFRNAENRYRELEHAYNAGRISEQDYKAAVNQISVQDESGRHWKIQAYSGQWHVYMSGQWQPAHPPQSMPPNQPKNLTTPPEAKPRPISKQTSPAKSVKRSKHWRVFGCILLSLVSMFCVVGSLGFLGMLSIGFWGGSMPERKVIQAHSVNIDRSGDTFQLGDLVLEISENNLHTPVMLTLTEVQLPPDQMIVSQTNLFEIDGLPFDFQGELQVTIKLPDELLENLDQNDPRSAEHLVFFLGSTSYATTRGGLVENEFPVSAEFDLANQLASLTVQPEVISESTLSGRMRTASLNPSFGGQAINTDATQQISFSIKNVGAALRILESDNFILMHYWGDITEEQASGIIHQLEKNRTDLISMGWQWDPRWVRLGDYKISAFLTSYPSDKGDVGVYHYSIFNGPSLTIYPKAFEEHAQVITATIGHELMHHAQMVAHLQRDGNSFLYNRQNDWFMLDEAVATWYESQATNNPDWLPAQALLNIEFYRDTPWFFMTSGDANTEGAGYGSSWLIRYFVNRFGTDSLRTAYQTKGIISGADALVFAAQREGASISLLFLDFLEVYFYFPEQLSAELIESPEYQFLLNRTLTLEATNHALKFNGRLITRDGREKKIDVKTIDGKIEDGLLTEPPWALISVELPASMTAYFFHFQIPEEGTLWQDSAVVTIQPETGGMFVHAYNLERDSWETLAGQTNFLSKGVRDSLTIDVNKYSDLEIVIFNTTGISNSAYQYASVAIVFDPGEIPIAPEQPITTGSDWIKTGTYQGGIGWYRNAYAECFMIEKEEVPPEDPFSVTITRNGDQYLANGQLINFSRDGHFYWTEDASGDARISFVGELDKNFWDPANTISGSFTYYFKNDQGDYFRSSCFAGYFSVQLK